MTKEAVQKIVSPHGDVLVVMQLAHYERLFAAAGHLVPHVSTANDAAPEQYTAPPEVREAIEAGESPLAAWRRFRRISQSALAKAAGVSRFTVMRIEAAGEGAGNRHSRRMLAAALNLPVSAI